MAEGSSVHYNSIEEFYLATRPERIRETCLGIYKAVHPLKSVLAADPSSEAEWKSWENSLPDFAEFLYDARAYRDKVIADSKRLETDLRTEIDALRSLAESEELRLFVSSGVFTAFRNAPGLERTKKALSKDSARDLAVLEDLAGITDRKKLNAIADRLEAQLADISGNRAKLESITRGRSLRDICVDLEYPLPRRDRREPKRIDVLLSDPENKRYAIIELKQWTEECIDVSAEEEDGVTRYYVNVDPGKWHVLHPALTVRDVYKPLLKEAFPEADICCFVYLHNQMYDGSQLYGLEGEDINIYDDRHGPNGILYTRMWHERLMTRLSRFFGKFVENVYN